MFVSFVVQGTLWNTFSMGTCCTMIVKYWSYVTLLSDNWSNDIHLFRALLFVDGSLISFLWFVQQSHTVFVSS